MNVVFCGHNIRAIKCLDKISNNKDFTISLVVTHPCKDLQDHTTLHYHAQQLGLKTIDPININDTITLETIKKYNPDIIILSGYTQIVKKDFLKIANKITINLHGGKLPQYRGSAPLNWMLINDEKEFGISIIEVAPGIDTGDILSSRSFTINDKDTIETIVDRTLELFPNMLEEVLYQIKNNNLIKISQKINEGSYYPSRKPNDGLIIWEEMTAREVFNLVRALQKPYPPAFSFFKNKKIYIHEAIEYNDETIFGLPGKVILKRNNGVLVMCKDKCLLLKTLQFENGKTIHAQDILSRENSFRTLRTILLGEEIL